MSGLAGDVIVVCVMDWGLTAFEPMPDVGKLFEGRPLSRLCYPVQTLMVGRLDMEIRGLSCNRRVIDKVE